VEAAVGVRQQCGETLCFVVERGSAPGRPAFAAAVTKQVGCDEFGFTAEQRPIAVERTTARAAAVQRDERAAAEGLGGKGQQLGQGGTRIG
jgi:hypothetical protein